MRVATSDGDLLVARVQPEGKRPMEARAFAASRPNLIGKVLSTES
jgi:methionyl-tRNA formyltransferase